MDFYFDVVVCLIFGDGGGFGWFWIVVLWCYGDFGGVDVFVV